MGASAWRRSKVDYSKASQNPVQQAMARFSAECDTIETVLADVLCGDGVCRERAEAIALIHDLAARIPLNPQNMNASINDDELLVHWFP